MMHIALGSIQDFAYVFDRDGRFTYASPFLLRLLGIALEEIVGKNFHDLPYPEELATRLQAQIQEVFDTGRVVRDSTPFAAPTGVEGTYEYIFSPVVGADGAVEWVAGSTRDISERRRAEEERERLLQELEAEQAKLNYLFEKAPAFVATLTGPEHIFELANPAYSQLIGYREVVGKTVREALPEIAGQGFYEILDQVFQTGESFIGQEVPIKLCNATTGTLEQRYLDFAYQPIFDSDGAVSGIFVHGVDITGQVHARREAESANRAKDEFLATLSHELRSPLAAIMGWTSILQSGLNSTEEIELGLDTIARNARAQSQLIEDILDVSRMIAGKMRLALEPVGLRVIVEDALLAIAPQAFAKNVALLTTLQEGDCLVAGDATRLQQIVRNLLSNALKFTPEGGSVQVTLECLGDHANVSVADSGIGMAPDMLIHVFERFRQVDSSTTRAQSGLGLGLAIVRHLVELHHGTVEAHSAGLGHGATFTVSLPLLPEKVATPDECEAQPPGEPAASAPENQTRLDGVHVLLVDDGEDIRRFLTVVLEKYGAQVTAVASAAEAFTALGEVRPHIILSDIGMPGEDGFSLIKRIRALPPDAGGQTPAIALTAFARAEDRAEVLRAGFEAHLAKPIDAMELMGMIGRLAGRGVDTAGLGQ